MAKIQFIVLFFVILLCTSAIAAELIVQDIGLNKYKSSDSSSFSNGKIDASIYTASYQKDGYPCNMEIYDFSKALESKSMEAYVRISAVFDSESFSYNELGSQAILVKDGKTLWFSGNYALITDCSIEVSTAYLSKYKSSLNKREKVTPTTSNLTDDDLKQLESDKETWKKNNPEKAKEIAGNTEPDSSKVKFKKQTLVERIKGFFRSLVPKKAG